MQLLLLQVLGNNPLIVMATSTKVMLSKMMSDDVKQLILKKVLTKRNDVS